MSGDPLNYARSSPPGRYDIATLVADFETFEDASDRSKQLIKTLRGGDRQAQRLARRLAKCRKMRRCGISVCPKCLRPFRRWYVGQILRLVEGDDVVHAATLIPDVLYRAGELYEFDLRTAKRTFQRQLARTDLADCQVFGGIDISMNIGPRKRKKWWQYHYDVLIVGASKKEIAKALRPYFPITIDTPRPILIREVTVDLPRRASYCLKAYFERRVRYRDDRGHLNVSPNGRRLKPDELRELAVHVAEFSVADRMVIRGARRYSDQLRVLPTRVAEKSCRRGAKRSGGGS